MFVFQTANHREKKIIFKRGRKGTGGLDIISSLAKSKAIGPEPRVFTIHFLRGYPCPHWERRMGEESQSRRQTDENETKLKINAKFHNGKINPPPPPPQPKKYKPATSTSAMNALSTPYRSSCPPSSPQHI
ncbi:synaptotagmin-5 [Platysternon megacephalum]|uniref:Synaptotagmin-5 n=1 Tax=Platysternon megacephalum TaxID=55544 RepID=A0A4D9DKY3_9SAUR|nr:synaptotagmin-5 [Platysternon megacephalum]